MVPCAEMGRVNNNELCLDVQEGLSSAQFDIKV